MRTRRATTTLLTAIAVGSLLAGAFPSAGQASSGKQDGKKVTTRFGGSCSLKGTVHFEPGATFLSQPLRYDFTGQGTCSGRLNGRRVTDVPVTAHQYGRAEGSCLEARTTRRGSGRITFPGGKILTYTLEFEYAFPETNFTWYGTRSGKARGTGTFRTDRTPPDTTARCATPEGAVDVPMDVTMRTITPLVSRN